MDTNHIIIAIVAIVVLILIIKFAKSVIKFVLIVLLVIGLGIYGFLYLNSIDSIDDLHNKYCKNLSDRKDSLKCVCIVEPLEEDFNSRFTKKEMENMNSLKFTTELSISFAKKNNEIRQKLQEHNALNLFDEFQKDMFKK